MNVASKWIPVSKQNNLLGNIMQEIDHFEPGIPWVLAGNKSDLLGDEEQLKKLKERKLKPIAYEQVLCSTCTQ